MASKKISVLFRLFFVTLLLPAAFSVNQLHAAEPFEGIIYVSMLEKSEGSSMDVKYFVKPGKVRMENRVSNLSQAINIILIDYEQGKMYTLRPHSKQYTEFTLPSEDDTAAAMEEGDDDLPTEPKKTGKTEEMHGYTCEQWLLKEDGEMEIEIWMAKGLQPIKGIGGKVPFGGDDAMPFKVITRTADGEEISRMEVTAISKKSIDDDTFTLPKDYKQVSLEESFPTPGK
jgi:hypothetical protein